MSDINNIIKKYNLMPVEWDQGTILSSVVGSITPGQPYRHALKTECLDVMIVNLSTATVIVGSSFPLPPGATVGGTSIGFGVKAGQIQVGPIYVTCPNAVAAAAIWVFRCYPKFSY